MEHIISPWLFYWLTIIDNILATMVVFSILLGIGVIIAGVANFIARFDSIEEDIKKTGYIFKKLFISFIICLFFAIVIPSKTTLIQMVVADKLTYDNVEKITETGKKFKETIKKDVIDIINNINKETNKED